MTLVITAWFFSSPAGCEAASFDYLYIEAGEGNSSGGHAAIQFGNDIFHFQHLDAGLIRLFKREKEDFHFGYRYLQNRPIHLSRIDVTEETFEVLKEYFNLKFLNQERLFKLLDDLHKDRSLIRYLLNKSPAGNVASDTDASLELRLKGVGLFYPGRFKGFNYAGDKWKEQPSLSINRLRETVEQHFGPDFLSERRKEIESRIKTLNPIDWSGIIESFAGENLPLVYSFADRYLDYLTALFAIDALIEAKPLQDDAVFQIRQAAFKLSKDERAMLMNWRKRLETSLVNSINSERPDWGYAVLVNLARYLAVEASLQSGYWVFIDDFAENSDRIGPADYLEQTERIQILINDARADWDFLRQAAINRRLTEVEYSRMEMAANRYAELVKSGEAVEIRFNGEKALPLKSIGLPDGPFPELTEERLKSALSRLDAYENDLLDRLKQDYRYDLITRNCVTELFRTINLAFSANIGSKDSLSEPALSAVTESEKRLGGYIDAAYNFIPFVSDVSVRDHYHVSVSRYLDSYRGLELKKLMARENKLLAALKESNTVSSRLYNYHSGDALFLFFTDDSLPLRPIFGLFNAAAGIGQSLYGLFNWPFDSGKNLKSGARGLLMSLPELLFFNMRKGSYSFLSPKLLASPEASGL
ncbi:MAG: hypothetical protein ACU83O_05605 [Gammaproteobacteria bacterium]